jgi:hypothetical protein
MVRPPESTQLYQPRGRSRCGVGPPWAHRPGWEPHASENPIDALATGMTPNLRASDDERAAVSDALTRHHLAGRLDIDEYTERLELAYGAKTRGDLAPLLVDLPPDTAPSHPRAPSPRGLWLVPLFAFAVLATLTVATGHPFILGGWWILVAVWLWRWSRPAPPTGSRHP